MMRLAVQSSPSGNLAVPKLTIPAGATINISTLIPVILGWLAWGAGAIAFGFLIYGGILFVTSGGDAEKATKARNTILYAIVGIIVVVLSYAIITFANTLATGK